MLRTQLTATICRLPHICGNFAGFGVRFIVVGALGHGV
jgi:hypothetical protein